MTKTWFFLVMFSLFFTAPSARAGQVDNLYQVTVPAENGIERWQAEALNQVLVKVSGNSEVSAVPAVLAELKQPAAYIKQYEVIRDVTGNKMRVLLDASKVNQLLQQNNIAVWGSLRPDILIWLVNQDGAEREFVRLADAPMNVALKGAFNDAGLPLLQPLYDMDDLMVLSPTDVWAGFWQQVNKASGRYNANEVIAATVDRVSQDGRLIWRLTWQRQQDGRVLRDEVLAENEQTLIQQFTLALSSQLAARYASIMSDDMVAELVVEVQQLADFADIVQVQRLLQQIVGVNQVTIDRYQPNSAHYKLAVQVSADTLMNALRFNPRLKIHQVDGVENTVDTTLPPVLATFNYQRL